MPAWAGPDPQTAAVAPLPPGLDIQLLERSGDWGHVLCSNGWSAWDDARLLEPHPAAGATSRMVTEPVVDVTAALRGVSFWGWHTDFTVADQTGTQIGSGAGLGRRGQIAGSGFMLEDPQHGRVIQVRPTRDKHLIVSDGSDREIGRIGREAKGLKGRVKPNYPLEAQGAVLAQITTDTHWANRWTASDPAGAEIARITDTTKVGILRKRSATCRIEIHYPVALPLRILLLAAGAERATFRMKYYSRPRSR